MKVNDLIYSNNLNFDETFEWTIYIIYFDNMKILFSI